MLSDEKILKYREICRMKILGFTIMSLRILIIMWAATWQNQQNVSAPSEDTDQPGHPPSLNRVFAVRMKKAWVLSYPLSARRRLWSDLADTQADLSLRWAHSHFVGFDMMRLMWGEFVNHHRRLVAKLLNVKVTRTAHNEGLVKGTVYLYMSHIMSLRYFPSSANSCFKRAYAAIQSLRLLYFHTSSVRTAKALARLRGCADSPQPSTVAYVISAIISWAGSVFE